MIRRIAGLFTNRTPHHSSPVTRDMLVNNMNDGILVLDQDGIVVDINRATLALTGLREAELIGKPAPKEFLALLQKTPSDREATRARLEVKWERPALRYLDVSISSIHDEHAQLTHRLFVLRDITKQKQIEKMLRMYNNQLNILHEIERGILQAATLDEAAVSTLYQLQAYFACPELRLIEFDWQGQPHTLAEIRTDHLSPLPPLPPALEALDASLLEGKVMMQEFAYGDTEGDPDRAEPRRTVVTVPLRGQRVPRAEDSASSPRGLVGLLILAFASTRSFEQPDMDLLRDVGSGLAATIANVRLQEETRRRALQLKTASEIARDVARAGSLEELIARAVNLIRDRFNFYHAGIYLLDEKREFAELRAATGEAGEQMQAGGHKLRPGDGSPVGEVLVSGQPKIGQFPVGGSPSRFLPETRAELTLPLGINEEVIGALDVHGSQPDAFREDDIVALKIMADQLAIAVENARLHQASRQRLDETVRQIGELAVLYAVAQAGAESSDEDVLIERTTQIIGDTFYPDNFGVLLVDEEAGVVRTHASYRGVQSIKKLGEGITGRVASDGRPRLIADVARSSGYIRLDDETRSEICVPIKVDQQVIGVINAESRQVNAFTLHDERLLTTVSRLLATAIQKARFQADLQAQTKQLASALAKQKELDRLKSQFIQNVSHELRTPLAIIRGYAELLDSGDLGEIEAAYKGPISTIARRAAMLSNMVDDLIAILEAEERALKMEDFDLGGLIKTLLGEFEISAQNAGIVLTSHIANGLPPFHGDPNHMRRVIDNLVSNALKFTPEGGRVDVSLATQDNHFILKVSDTGIGIPEDELERIFERFYQVDGSLSRRYGGTGLGLSLVHEIVLAHHGRIHVESQVGQGTTFIIRIPLQPGEARTEP